VYHQGKLYGSTGEGLISVSAATGQVLWTNQNAIDDFGGEPVIVGDKIFMPSTPGGRHVFAVNKADGNVLWNYAYDGQMGGRVLHNNGRIFFGTSSSKVYALDANTGALIWTRNFHNATDDYGCDGLSPVTFNGNIIIHHYPEGFIALNPVTGNTVWAAQDASDISCSQPAIGNGLLYFTLDGGAGRSIVAIRGDNGQLAWETPTTSPSLGNVIFVNNRLYMQSRTNIQIRSAADGSLINIIDWGGGNGVGSAAISLNGVAYYGTGRGNY
jgi:outer membrane protein assembly factor BamB